MHVLFDDARMLGDDVFRDSAWGTIWSITIDALVVPKSFNSVCTRTVSYLTREQNYLQEFQ